MVKCQICGKCYKRLDISHLQMTHNITSAEYLTVYPHAVLISKESKEAYSKATFNHFSKMTKEERSERQNYERTKQQKEDIAKRLKKGRDENHDRIYGADSKRNTKISESKKKWWTEKSETERSIFWKNNKKVEIERDEEGYYIRSRKLAYNAHLVAVKNGKSKVSSKFELEMLDVLRTSNIDYAEQYELEGWHFDCYLPKCDTLVEFDGDFWHPKTLGECNYTFQITNFWKAIRKNKYAAENGYRLIRIRHSEKNIIHELINKGTLR